MKVGIYPGSFDPVTFGHLDIIERSAKIVDELVVGVLNNSAKNSLFSLEERVSMIKEMTAHIPNVRVGCFEGLLVDYMKKINATIIIRGLRAVTDFEYELQIAQANGVQNPEIETVFLTSSLNYSYLSSTIVKEFASYGGDISKFVPEQFIDRIVRQYEDEKKKNPKEYHYAYEELKMATVKMKSGVSEINAINQYGERCGLHNYIKLANIIEQNIRRGTGELSFALENELNRALVERKNTALKRGSEISTKLLGPMTVMLIVALVILMVPALMSINM
jgi:pantetheine-phosphate adenylyltransferase